MFCAHSTRYVVVYYNKVTNFVRKNAAGSKTKDCGREKSVWEICY